MLISGRALSQPIIQHITDDIESLKFCGITPKIAIVTAGPESSWETYVRQKMLFAETHGITASIINLSNLSREELKQKVEELNNDRSTHGIIIQRPLPRELNSPETDQLVTPDKDIDGFNPHSKFSTPVWLAVRDMLVSVSNNEHATSFEDWLANNKITVIGKGETGGGPIIKGLEQLGVHPEIIDTKTQKPLDILRDSDIVISATGTRYLTPGMVKHGCILIGVGIHKSMDGKFRGEYDGREMKTVASYYSPTPGGVGPLNLAYLFSNLLEAAKAQL